MQLSMRTQDRVCHICRGIRSWSRWLHLRNTLRRYRLLSCWLWWWGFRLRCLWRWLGSRLNIWTRRETFSDTISRAQKITELLEFFFKFCHSLSRLGDEVHA